MLKINRLLVMCAGLLMTTTSIADKPITVKAFTSGDYVAKTISGMNALAGTSEYARISSDGKTIESYSFKTGKKTGVLFDVSQTHGVTLDEFENYSIAPDGHTMLIETNHKRIYRRSYTADFYVYDVKSKQLRRLSTDGREQIPTFSPDSKKIAFVRNNNIYIAEGENIRQVTHDGEFNKIINGIPDWVNEEEFSFNNALAWSADSKTLSWIRYDESRVKTYSLQMFRGDEPALEDNTDYPGLYSYKYPKAGQENSIVTAWSYSLDTGKTIQYALPLDSDGYIPRIRPTSDAGRILLFTMNCHQDRLNIYAANPVLGKTELLISEKNAKYVKEEAIEGVQVTGKHLVLPSDRDGVMALYLYDLHGNLLKKLSGNREVTEVYGMDEKSGVVYYQAVGATPMDRVICALDKDITTDRGWNSASFSADFRFFLCSYSTADTPYIYTIYDNHGRKIREVLNNQELQDSLKEYNLRHKEFFTFTTSEGVELNGWMIKPADFDANKKYPVILFQYSGPGSQQVTNRWGVGSMGNGGMFDYYMAQHGYIVACVDGRGTGGRGADFEKCTYLRIGELESRDQVETALWLQQQTFVDSTRIGIWGWSYGGFNTLMSMSEGRPVFKAGVAVAPPTNWKFYDSVYTERYMRTPQENPEGYAINPIERAANLHGKLLICHGMADDNVHPQNTFEYSEALVQYDKDFREILYTNRNHSIYGGNTRNHLLRQVSEWFFDNL